MKKILYLFALISLSFTIFSCNQDIDFPYEGKDRLHFKHFNVDYNGKRSYIDSVIYSFGLKPDTVLKDTLKYVVELVGRTSSKDRTYRVEILQDSTTAIEGVHYEPFSRDQIFRAKRVRDTLKIVIIRKDMSIDHINPVNMRLDLILKESADFAIGLTKGEKVKILLNDYLTEPIWWVGNFQDALGYFHPLKWKILISFHESFANENSCPFNVNNEGRGYITGLSTYLDKEYVYEVIDGKKYRLNMYSKDLIEEK